MKDERAWISFDYAMKLLLRNKIDFEILEGFLSEVLSCDVSVKNIGESESNKENPDDKFNRVDILIEAESNEVILVELQFESEADYLQRMLFGTCKTITEYMRQGDKYVGVKKVYSINIVYFDLGEGSDYVYRGKTHFTGLHKNDELRLTDTQREMFGKEVAGDIYPEYYILKVNNFGGEAKNSLDEWIYFFKTNIIKEDFNAKGIVKAREILTVESLTPEERKEFNSLQSARSHELSIMATAEDTGEMRGLKRGRKEGIAIGKKEREKLAKKLEIERNKREKRDEELEMERKERVKQNKELERVRKEREKRDKELAAQNKRIETLLAELAKSKQKKQKIKL
ncbi:MAG: Rpn family recombination-promoting nuclease/putative transposase [Planctomycetaceae bacterium]|jgi:predicted transposase/invertase (TIGR01784 family)|nr:Rpn family recombination-promoting nuclease/putative transposase [Planctomycetaceae bacterium]